MTVCGCDSARPSCDEGHRLWTAALRLYHQASSARNQQLWLRYREAFAEYERHIGRETGEGS